MPTVRTYTAAFVNPLTLVPGDFVLLSGWCYVTGEVTQRGANDWTIPLVKEDGDETLVTIHREIEKLIDGHPYSWQPDQLRLRVEQMRKRADVLTQLAVKLDAKARSELAIKAQELHATYSRIASGQAKPWAEMNETERAGWYHRAQGKLDNPS